MDLGLKDKNSVVIGGSRGIGRSIALGLAAEGANVAICARNEEFLRAAEAEVTAAGVRAYAHAKKLGVMQAPRGIRVNAIAPGSIEFPGGIWSMVKQQQPEVYEGVRASIPWGRLGTPEEVADVAVFLVSPRAAWVAGECLSVGGAQHRGIR